MTALRGFHAMVKIEGSFRLFVCLSCVAIAALGLDSAARAASETPAVTRDVRHDISPPLRELAKAPRSGASLSAQPPPERETRPLPPAAAGAAPASSVLQSSPGSPLAVTAGLNFEGIAADGPSPPDTNGSVGATQYVQTVNFDFAVYDKTSGAALLGPLPMNTLWSGFGGLCETNNGGDPVVLWDKAAHRWLISQLVYTSGFSSNFQCIAVSTSADATGSWARYAFDFGANLPDYPKYGVWPDAYYSSTNTFPNGGAFTGAQACAFDRTAMLSGNPATKVCFQEGSNVASLLPADLDGTTPPPAGAPETFLELNDGSSLALFRFHVDFQAPANSTFTGPTILPVAAYSQACGGGACVPQPGTTTVLDTLGDRVMFRLAYRNLSDHEALVVNHSVVAGSSVGVRWYEIRDPNGTPTLFQQGTYAPDATYRWMGSAAMDQRGDIAVGYSASSSSVHPAIRYAGRVPSDPAGTLGAEASIIEGAGSQTGGLSRWGDYSSMSVDADDDCTFWYTTEYYPVDGSGSWHTRIGSFKFDACGGPDGTVHFVQPDYGCASQITIRVVDSNVGATTLPVTVWSTTESTPEDVTLAQTAPGSAEYTGAIPATSDGPVFGDGMLSVQDGDVLTVQYVDADDGAGNHGVPHTDAASVDCTPPTISSVGTTAVSDVQATVTWLTNENASSDVTWGPTKPPANAGSTFGLTTSHHVLLAGLQQCTTYWYAVRSQDLAGNTAIDDSGGQDYHFETLGDLGSGLQSCHAGRISLARSTVACSDTLSIALTDLDLNLSPTAVDTAQVTVSSTTEPTPEIVTLTETGPNTSRFAGSIAVRTGAPAPDGILEVSSGDLLSATYHDADDGTGSAAISEVSGSVDCTGAGSTLVEVRSQTDESVQVHWVTTEPTTGRVDWGPTPALGNSVSYGTLATDHSVTLPSLAECGAYYFRIATTDAYGNASTLDNHGSPYAFDAWRIPAGVFKDDFETTTGWTLDGDWQIAAPQGLGTAPADPATAFSGTKVLGEDLTGLGAHPGDYEPGQTHTATSPVIDATNLANGQLRFRRKLSTGDGGTVKITVLRGNVPFGVFSSTSTIADSGWSLQTVNLSPYADGTANLRIQFTQIGGPTVTHSGWNIDRLIVNSANQPAFEACGGCGAAPSFAGLTGAADADACGATGIALTWNAAASWGSGSSGTYAVYRDTTPGFTPSAANRIVAGVTGTTYTDPSAPTGVTLYYLVRAENDETCATGPNNGGVVDGNATYLSAQDQTSQPAPGAVGSTLVVAGVNDAEVRLTWAAAPNAARYHVYRASQPQGPFTQIANVTGLLYEDPDQYGGSNPWYYLVRAADACGNEGP